MQAEREARGNVTPSLPEDTLWVRFAFVDHAGIPKAKAVHRDGFARRAQAGVGLAKGVLALDPSGALHPESGLSPVGECRLVPDLSTLTPLPFASNQAMVTCDMTEPDARTPWEGCPRSALKRVLGRLAERGYRSIASYEAEFYVWGPEGPLDRTPYAGSFALTTAAEFVAELAETLEEMGIRPEQCHAEVGHGNLELSVGEVEALAAADKRVMVLEAIRGVAHKIGLETTMAPKPYLHAAGNGHHLHVSLYEGEDPVLFDGSGALSGPGRGLVGGLLEHLPAVMAFTAPSPNSYQRLAPGMWTSPPTPTWPWLLSWPPGWTGLTVASIPASLRRWTPPRLARMSAPPGTSDRSPPRRTRRSTRWRGTRSSSMRSANLSCEPTSPWRGRRQRWRGNFRRKRWRPPRRSFTEGSSL